MRRWNRLWDIVLGVIVSLLCAFPVSAREKVILDSDMVEGFDDGVAMLALAQSPGIELIGVTIVAGNTWVSDGVAYALRQLEIAGQNIPVAAGVDRPFRPQRYELFGLERQLFGMGHGSARSDTQNRNHGKRFIGSATAKSLSRAPIPVMRWISSLKRCGNTPERSPLRR